MCSYILHVHKKKFQSFSRSNYQCHQSESTCQVTNIPFEERTNSFLYKFGRKIYFFEATKNSIRDVIGEMHCPTCPNGKCVQLSTNKISIFYDCKKCRAHSHVLNIPNKEQKPTLVFFGGDGAHCFARETSGDYEKEKQPPFLKMFLHQSNHNQANRNLSQKKAKIMPIMA